MSEDKQLGTGEYDPERYWDARAGAGSGSALKAVCVFKASDVENETAHRVQIKAMWKALKMLDLREKNVLEYGCGVGRWVPFFRQRGAVWHGVDISSEMLSVAKSRHGDVDLKKVVDNGIPYPDSSMDFVYSVTVIHHNPFDVQEAIIAEMARVLKVGGHLLLLEDISSGSSFNMFPRGVESWIDLAGRHGFSLCNQKKIGYWVLRDVTDKILRRFRCMLPGGTHNNDGSLEHGGQSYLKRLVNRLDMIIDPYVYSLLPGRFKTTAVFLFRKAG